MGNQGFRDREAFYPYYYASRGRVLPILVYFYLKGVDLNGFRLKGMFGIDLRGCLALFPAFVPYLMAQLGTVLGPFYGCFMAGLWAVLWLNLGLF